MYRIPSTPEHNPVAPTKVVAILHSATEHLRNGAALDTSFTDWARDICACQPKVTPEFPVHHQEVPCFA